MLNEVKSEKILNLIKKKLGLVGLKFCIFFIASYLIQFIFNMVELN